MLEMTSLMFARRKINYCQLSKNCPAGKKKAGVNYKAVAGGGDVESEHSPPPQEYVSRRSRD